MSSWLVHSKQVLRPSFNRRASSTRVILRSAAPRVYILELLQMKAEPAPPSSWFRHVGTLAVLAAGSKHQNNGSWLCNLPARFNPSVRWLCTTGETNLVSGSMVLQKNDWKHSPVCISKAGTPVFADKFKQPQECNAVIPLTHVFLILKKKKNADVKTDFHILRKITAFCPHLPACDSNVALLGTTGRKCLDFLMLSLGFIYFTVSCTGGEIPLPSFWIFSRVFLLFQDRIGSFLRKKDLLIACFTWRPKILIYCLIWVKMSVRLNLRFSIILL